MSADEPTPKGAPGSSAILLGRSLEMEELIDALVTAASGEGRVVLMSGEAGIGKTWLAHSLGTEARRRGARVLWGRCWEAGGAPAYWPWLQAIRTYLLDVDPSTLEVALGTTGPDLAVIVPELRALLPGLPTAPHDESEGARFRVFEATSRFLRNIAAGRPLVLILDDLHAADEPSLRLLQFVAADLPGSRILVLAIHREDGTVAEDARSAILADVARAPGARRLGPRPLSIEDVSGYIELMSRASPAPGLIETVHRQTGGNPLFVTEVVRLFAEEGRLDRIHPSIGRPFRIPEGVRAVIGRRLARLSQPCRELLARASVIGGEFALDLLARLEDRPSDDLLEQLDEAAAARVLIEPASPGGRWRFGHGLTREVLYASLSASARARLHRRVGETLEALHGRDPEPPLPELALHFVAASVTNRAATASKAIDYARRAAESATLQYAHEESVRLYLLALEVGDLGERVRCDLLLGLGEAASRAGDQSTMRAAFLEAATIAGRIGPAEDQARAAIGYGGRLVHRRAGDDSRLVPLLEGALAALPAGDSDLRVRLLARLAGALRDEPTMERRTSLSAEAVTMARRLGDPISLGYALQSRHSAIWGPDALPEMGDLLDEIGQLATASGDRERLAANHWNRMVLLATEGAPADVFRSELEAGARVAHELRQPAYLWYQVQWQAATALNDARLADAEALLEEVRLTGDRSLPWDADYAYRLGLFVLRREQGRLAEVAAEIRRAADDFPGYRLLWCFAAYADAVAGRSADARRALDEIARNGFAFLPRDLGWPFGMVFLGETALLLGDHQRASDVSLALGPYGRLFATASGVFPGGPVERVLGLLAADAGRLDEALRRLDATIASCARAGLRLWETRATVDRAGILLRRAAPGDRESARGLLESAFETCQALGLADIGKTAGSLLAAMAPAVPSPSGIAQDETAGRPARTRISFHREGDYWAIGSGPLFRLHDAKGLRYLAILLAQPGREFHVLDLLAQVRPAGLPTPASASAASHDLRTTVAPPAEPVIDDSAKQAYRDRLRDLQEEIDEAEAYNDPERAERAAREVDAIEAELAAAFGLGGKARPGPTAAERARQSVTKAIHQSLRRIEDQDAGLGGHLSRAVRTGQYCTYDPDPASIPAWSF